MKEKSVAAILCFFLGCFGVHKFYLRKTGAGVTYLLITIFLGWLGIGLIITGVLSLIDFVMLLCKDQNSFDKEYNSAYLNEKPQQQQTNERTQQPMYSQPIASQQELNAPLQQSGKTKAEQILELKSLLDQGVLSQEEFDAEKQKVLNS